jgi:hypothetical protein
LTPKLAANQCENQNRPKRDQKRDNNRDQAENNRSASDCRCYARSDQDSDDRSYNAADD